MGTTSTSPASWCRWRARTRWLVSVRLGCLGSNAIGDTKAKRLKNYNETRSAREGSIRDAQG